MCKQQHFLYLYISCHNTNLNKSFQFSNPLLINIKITKPNIYSLKPTTATWQVRKNVCLIFSTDSVQLSFLLSLFHVFRFLKKPVRMIFNAVLFKSYICSILYNPVRIIILIIFVVQYLGSSSNNADNISICCWIPPRRSRLNQDPFHRLSFGDLHLKSTNNSKVNVILETC